jgi:GT2 family glycosyltransferase
VIICTYDQARWKDLCEAVRSVWAQTLPAWETLVVVDHNPGLLDRLRNVFPTALVVANEAACGASGARNTGASRAHGDWLAFLDDDTVAEPEWLAGLLAHRDDPGVLGVGGRVLPLWHRRRPGWFPDEFAWVVGASYRGLPPAGGPVRNVWSENMLISRAVFDAVGGFRVGFGKTGARSAPEDTDLCLRARQAFPAREWRYEPDALVGHKVPAARSGFGFFLRRCYSEGRGKADLLRLLPGADGVSAEMRHAGALPAAVAREAWACVRGDASALLRAAAIVVGLVTAVAGLGVGLVAGRLERRS